MERIRVRGMSCQHCVNAVRKALEGLGGLDNIQVDLEAGEVRFERTGDVSLERIRSAIEGAGYTAE